MRRSRALLFLARFAYAPFSLYEVYEGVNERANERQRDPEGANNAHDEECALATIMSILIIIDYVQFYGPSRADKRDR